MTSSIAGEYFIGTDRWTRNCHRLAESDHRLAAGGFASIHYQFAYVDT